MIRALLIYAAAVTAAIVGGSVALGVPLEWIAWTVLLVEAVPLATWGGAMLIRRMMRQPRQDWTHLGCDPVAPPLPAPAPRVRIEAPQPLLLEAPGREIARIP